MKETLQSINVKMDEINKQQDKLKYNTLKEEITKNEPKLLTTDYRRIRRLKELIEEIIPNHYSYKENGEEATELLKHIICDSYYKNELEFLMFILDQSREYEKQYINLMPKYLEQAEKLKSIEIEYNKYETELESLLEQKNNILKVIKEELKQNKKNILLKYGIENISDDDNNYNRHNGRY